MLIDFILIFSFHVCLLCSKCINWLHNLFRFLWLSSTEAKTVIWLSRHVTLNYVNQTAIFFKTVDFFLFSFAILITYMLLWYTWKQGSPFLLLAAHLFLLSPCSFDYSRISLISFDPYYHWEWKGWFMNDVRLVRGSSHVTFDI